MSPIRDRIDSLLYVVTPENIEFEYRLAGPFRRLPAFVIDTFIKTALILLIGLVSSLTLGQFSMGMTAGVFLISMFLINWFYGGVFESLMNGQTPGKWLLGMRVVTETGDPIDGLQAVMRNLLGASDIFLPIVGLSLMTMNRRYQRLGDLICGTIVVIEERQWLTGVVRLDDPRAIQLAGYLPPNFLVNRSLAKAISTYVERRRFFSLPRRREVARHLGEPLLVRFGLPADTSYDLLLCALYYRTFIADRGDDEKQLEAAQAQVRPVALPMGFPAFPGPAGVAPYPSPYGISYGQPPPAWPQPPAWNSVSNAPAGPLPLAQDSMAGTQLGGLKS